MMREGKTLVLFINGEEAVAVETSVPSSGVVYGVVDLYGQCVAVKVISGLFESNSEDNMTSERVTFHQVCGRNAKVGSNGLEAWRPLSSEEYNGATVFTNRPLRPDEWFEVKIKSTVDLWSGSIQMGKQAREI